jgi:hypothetical protein
MASFKSAELDDNVDEEILPYLNMAFLSPRNPGGEIHD